MKKFLKGSMSLVLALAVILGSLYVGFAEFDFNILLTAKAGVANSGSCGENVTWKCFNGTVTISGTGEMTEKPTWWGEPYEAKKLVIEEGVTGVCDFAFQNLRNITSVYIPTSVSHIGNNAFDNCKKLSAVYITDLVAWCNIDFESRRANPMYYAGSLYLNGELLEGEVVIPSGAHRISVGAFQSSDITSVVIPFGVTEIGDYAFGFNPNLTSVTIPESVVTIGESAFNFCRGLTEVTIPDSVTTIGKQAFGSCYLLKKATLSKNLTEIGEYAFYFCDALEEINIPGSVKTIGEHAFYSCESLTDVVFCEGVESIGKCAFSECANITAINIPESMKNISGWAFYNCENLRSITIPDTAVDMDVSSFLNTGFYNDVGDLGDGCLYMGNHLIIVGSRNAGSFEVREGTITIAGSAFSGCREISSVYIPDSVVLIGDSAFRYCEKLEEIDIPDSVVSMGWGVFEDCSGLKSVKLSQNLEALDYYFFSGCTSLESITIPNGVTSIPSYAFKGCINLRSIDLPDGVEYIGQGALTDTAFYNNADNWENGVLYLNNYLLKAKDLKSARYEIKDGTKIIADNAFNLCDRLVSVSIPDSVTAIGEYAFSGCHNLASVMMAEGVITIGEGAFKNCSLLQSVIIPTSVTSIGDYALGYDAKNNKLDGLVIGGKTDTAAEAYANINGFGFVDAQHIHALMDWEIIKEPTVKAIGVKIRKCTSCGCVLDAEYISRLTPEAPVVEVASSDKTVFVSWNSVDGADAYIVYRRVYDAEAKKWSGWTRIAENITREFYSDCNVASGTYYIYTVKGVNEGGHGAYTSGARIYYLDIPDLLSLKVSNNRMTLKWQEVEGATGYIVYRRVRVKTDDVWQKEYVTNGTTYVIKNPEVDVMYRYTVRAYYGSYRSSVCSPGMFLAILPKPELKTADATRNGVRIEWNDVKASGESIVYRKTYDAKTKKWSGWTKLAIVANDNYYVDTTAKSGTYYRYTVKAITSLYSNGIAISPYDKDGLKIYYMATPTLKSATSAKSGVTLKWGKVTGATGYIVYRKTGNGSWVKLATVKGNGKISYLDKNAKKGTGYTYTVKAYYGSYKSSHDGKGLYVKDKY